MEIKVLNHGHIRLVDSLGNDLSIVRSARVSYNAEWRVGEDTGSDTRLINYLMKNKHTSPFESVVLTFDIKCPIFIARQWHRHRTWAYNEVSARYSELPEEFYIPDPRFIGKQHDSHKQTRDMNSEMDDTTRQMISMEIASQCRDAFTVYKGLLEAGTPREIARSVLPVATYTHFFGTVDLHNLFHFLRLRLHSHAQYEIRVYAEAILELIKPVVPVAVAAFIETLKAAS
jgi:thymidylate synthase (FAD)